MAKWGDIGHWLTGGLTTQKGRNFLLGSGNEFEKMPTGTKQQGQFNQDLLAMLQNMMQPGGNYANAQSFNNNLLQGGPEAFNQFADPYRQQFNEQVLPQIGERFAGAGALSSSGFGQALGGAASGFESQLAQMFTQMQQQAVGQEYGQFGQLSNQAQNYQPFAYNEKQGQAGFLPQILAALVKAYGGGGMG